MALSQFPNFPHQQMNAIFGDFMRKAKTSDLANNIKKKCYNIQMISAIFFRSDSMNSIRWELPIYSTWRGFFQRTTPLGDFFEFPKKPNEKKLSRWKTVFEPYVHFKIKRGKGNWWEKSYFSGQFFSHPPMGSKLYTISYQ